MDIWVGEIGQSRRQKWTLATGKFGTEKKRCSKLVVTLKRANNHKEVTK